MTGRFQAMDWSPGYMNVTPAHVTVMAECTACGQRREFFTQSLPASLRHALVQDVEKRLKCASCGAKAGKLSFGYHVAEKETK
ncbi:hypothetical protein Bra5_CH01916 [Rhizobium phaseoli Brasil 5]|nr:hypothetical protein Bra5_CH01916 [Rhizobium phaseoli Brasil 5]